MTSLLSLGYRDRDRYDSDRYRDGPRRDMDRFGGRDRYDDRSRDYDRGGSVPAEGGSVAAEDFLCVMSIGICFSLLCTNP